MRRFLLCQFLATASMHIANVFQEETFIGQASMK